MAEIRALLECYMNTPAQNLEKMNSKEEKIYRLSHDIWRDVGIRSKVTYHGAKLSLREQQFDVAVSNEMAAGSRNHHYGPDFDYDGHLRQIGFLRKLISTKEEKGVYPFWDDKSFKFFYEKDLDA